MKSSSCPYETPPPVGPTGAGDVEALGFVEIDRRGSHVKMEHTDGRRIVFPYHREIDCYTLKGALRDADIEVEGFLKHIK